MPESNQPSKKKRTAPQREASRRNGGKSKGPVTGAGKAISSRNHTVHGLCAYKNVILNNESPQVLDIVRAGYACRFQPADPVELDLVEQIVAAQWRLRRYSAVETALIDTEMARQKRVGFVPAYEGERCASAFQSLADHGNSLALAGRYQSRLTRDYYRAMKTFLELRRELPPPPGSSPIPRETPPPIPGINFPFEPEPNLTPTASATPTPPTQTGARFSPRGTSVPPPSSVFPLPPPVSRLPVLAFALLSLLFFLTLGTLAAHTPRRSQNFASPRPGLPAAPPPIETPAPDPLPAALSSPHLGALRRPAAAHPREAAGIQAIRAPRFCTIGLMAPIAAIQAALREEGLDGWLFFDHHRRDPLAYRVLRFEPAQSVSRRWYYLVPAQGEPRKMVHKIEAHVLDPLPGAQTEYAGWLEQGQALTELLAGCRAVAMQYSPNCAVPYISMIDAGTVELVKSCGANVRTSANLIQMFEARWSAGQYEMHLEAGRRVHAVLDDAWRLVAAKAGSGLTEYEVQQFIRAGFSAQGLVTDHGPIVAVNAHASNPHYEPSAGSSASIGKADLVLIDLWAKLDRSHAVYFDITWMGFCGATVPDEMARVFSAVASARDSGVALVKNAAARNVGIAGFQVDDAARGSLKDAGLAAHFFHRTGHSIGEEVHGNGANMDNYETHDERRIIPGTCFSIEPGVYLPAFGVRSEVNVYRGESHAEVTGPVQDRILPLLA